MSEIVSGDILASRLAGRDVAMKKILFGLGGLAGHYGCRARRVGLRAGAGSQFRRVPGKTPVQSGSAAPLLLGLKPFPALAQGHVASLERGEAVPVRRRLRLGRIEPPDHLV